MKLLSEIEQNDAVAETLDCFFDRSNEHRRRRVQIIRINPSSNESFVLGEFIRRRRGKLCFVFFLSSFSSSSHSSSSSVILLFLLLLLIFPLRRLRRRRRRRRRVRQRRVFCDGYHVFFFLSAFSISTDRERGAARRSQKEEVLCVLCCESFSAFCLCCFSFFFFAFFLSLSHF